MNVVSGATVPDSLGGFRKVSVLIAEEDLKDLCLLQGIDHDKLTPPAKFLLGRQTGLLYMESALASESLSTAEAVNAEKAKLDQLITSLKTKYAV